MTREEIVIKMGIDGEEIAAGLNRTNRYLERWREDKKRDESDYSRWWSSEVKKREEAEVKAAENAAARSARARELWAQRAAAREARYAEAARQNSGFQPGMPAQDGPDGIGELAMAGTVKKTLKGIKKMVSFNLAGLAAGLLTEVWDNLTEKAADLYFNVSGSANMGNAWDRRRNYFRSERQERANAAQKEAQDEQKMADSRKNRDQILGESREIEAQKNIIAQGGDVEQNLRLHREKKLVEDIKGLREQINVIINWNDPVAASEQQLQNAKTILEISKKEKDLEELKLDLAERQKRAKEAAAQASRNAAIEEYKSQFQADMKANDELNPFRPTVGELANSGQWVRGKWSGRWSWQGGPFANDAKMVERYKEEAKQLFMRGDVEGAKGAIADYNREYDKMAQLGILPDRPEITAQAIKLMSENIAAIADGKKTVTTKVPNAK